MHEFGIAQTTLRVVLEQMRAHEAKRVGRITLRIGTLTGVDQEALRFAFSALTRETAAESAELKIETVEARAACKACGTEFAAEDGFIFACPLCGTYSNNICQGREMDLVSLKLIS